MPKVHTTDTDPIRSLIPEGGWLGRYVKYSDPLEACARFRFFSACCALGAAINNKVFILRGDEGLLPKLFPNPWILLLAPPGRGHKTSTINMSTNCLQQACPGVRIVADKITPEAVIRTLSVPGGKEKIRIGPRDATGLIKAPEFSVFFGRQQYNTGLVNLITDLYDYREEWSNETIMRGKTVLKNVCISVVGGSTPEWLQTMIPDDAFKGGFMSRFILVEMPPNYFRRVPLPKKLPGDTWDNLVQELSYLGELKGQMEWSPDSESWYRKMYTSKRPTGDAQVDAYQERESEQIIKVAALLACSEARMRIEVEDFEMANRLLQGLMTETTPRIERLTTHPRMKLVQEIEDLLRIYDSVTQRQLLRMVYRGLPLGEQQFHEAIRVMFLSGMIIKEGSPSNPTIKLSGGDENGYPVEKGTKDSSKHTVIRTGGTTKDNRSVPRGKKPKGDK